MVIRALLHFYLSDTVTPFLGLSCLLYKMGNHHKQSAAETSKDEGLRKTFSLSICLIVTNFLWVHHSYLAGAGIDVAALFANVLKALQYPMDLTGFLRSYAASLDFHCTAHVPA